MNCAVFTVPGLNGSDALHWQTCWEKKFGYRRVQQERWGVVHLDSWAKSLRSQIIDSGEKSVVLVAHSMGCHVALYTTGLLAERSCFSDFNH